MPKKCQNKKSRENKIMSYPLPRDSTSSFIPYCTYDEHPGIVEQGCYKKCLRKACFYLYLLRPSGAEKEAEAAKETRVYRNLSEIEIKVRFL